MALKAVFFDAGQTLLYPAPDGESFSAVARGLGFDVTPEMVLAQTPAMYRRYEEHYQRDAGFWADHGRARSVWLDAYGLLYSQLGLGTAAAEASRLAYEFYFNPGAWLPYDDVVVAFEALAARGLRLGLISNWDRSLQAVVEGLGLTAWLSTVIASADVGLHKPEPAIFRLALAHLGVNPEEAVHVGDHRQADVEGALSAGLHAVLIDREGRHAGYDRAPRIEGLSELPALLDGLG